MSMKYEAECDICRHRQIVDRFDNWVCESCKQLYAYDESNNISLSSDQIDLLRSHVVGKPQSIRDQVYEFKKMCGHPMPSKPEVPPEERIRLCLSIVMEECLELVGACTPHEHQLRELSGQIQMFILSVPLKVNLPEAADACGDIDFVVEGFRREFGIDGRPIAGAIYEANMKKQGGLDHPETGKKLKPEGWTPPDIAGELRKQGWALR